MDYYLDFECLKISIIYVVYKGCSDRQGDYLKEDCVPLSVNEPHDHCATARSRRQYLYMRAFHLETIHFGEINNLKYMKLQGHCRDLQRFNGLHGTYSTFHVTPWILITWQVYYGSHGGSHFCTGIHFDSQKICLHGFHSVYFLLTETVATQQGRHVQTFLLWCRKYSPKKGCQLKPIDCIRTIIRHTDKHL